MKKDLRIGDKLSDQGVSCFDDSADHSKHEGEQETTAADDKCLYRRLAGSVSQAKEDHSHNQQNTSCKVKENGRQTPCNVTRPFQQE